MSRGRKCSECDFYSRKLDFGHPTCLDHRPCRTRSGYEPALCDSCDLNRSSWDPISRELSRWRHELRMHSNRMGGAEYWPFEASFSSFFEVVLASGSETGSRSRGHSPQRGRGSRSGSPLLPRTGMAVRPVHSLVILLLFLLVAPAPPYASQGTIDRPGPRPRQTPAFFLTPAPAWKCRGYTDLSLFFVIF